MLVAVVIALALLAGWLPHRQLFFTVRRVAKATRTATLFGLILIGASVAARSQTETVLYNLGAAPTDGFGPMGRLLLDASGNLFGTTSEGSTPPCDGGNVYGYGMVFELVKSSNGYSENVLYSFGSNSALTDGASPASGLISDASGNLYGTTVWGGADTLSVGE